MIRSDQTTNPATTGSVGNWLTPLGALVVLLGLMGWLTRPTLNLYGTSRLAASILVLAIDSLPVLLWLLAAFGFGWPAVRFLARSCRYRYAFQLSMGIALLLWLDHALGTLGLLQARSNVGAWILPGIGTILALTQLIRKTPRGTKHLPTLPPFRLPLAVWMGLPALAVLLVAATSAPGWLWDSEAGGYDVLEYHLQLPKEWLAIGRIVPFEHNVYSFAPNYMEAAYYHLAILFGPLTQPGQNQAVRAALACQLLHASFAVISACMAGLLAADMTGRKKVGGWIAALFVSIPWIVVTGSMAYNEMAVCMLLLLAIQISRDREVEAWRRGSVVGFAIGVACGAKMTAIGLVAVPGVIYLLMHCKIRKWPLLMTALTVAGTIAIAPYLVRNALFLEGGNPFFPFAVNLLGPAHWDLEQVARWSSAHQSDLHISMRAARVIEMAFWHRQWSGLWFIGVIALPMGLIRSQTRLLAIPLTTMLVLQVAFWISSTHLQSRFLVPCAVPLVLLIGPGIASLADMLKSPQVRDRAAGISGTAYVLAYIVAFAIVLLMGYSMIRLYEGQHDKKPATMIDGLATLTKSSLPDLPPQDRDLLLRTDPDAFVSFATDPRHQVYLLGDATPFYLSRPVLWHTTWDRSLLGQIIRRRPDEPDAWLNDLYRQGVRYLLVNYAELHRLQNVDGWYDPLVTTRRVRRMMTQSGAQTISRQVNAQGTETRILYRLPPPPPQSTADQP